MIKEHQILDAEAIHARDENVRLSMLTLGINSATDASDAHAGRQLREAEECTRVKNASFTKYEESEDAVVNRLVAEAGATQIV